VKDVNWLDTRPLNNIYVIDAYIEGACACGENSKFILGFNGQEVKMCHICMGELGKRIIDGLV
jgi:hypothetical protein